MHHNSIGEISAELLPQRCPRAFPAALHASFGSLARRAKTLAPPALRLSALHSLTPISPGSSPPISPLRRLRTSRIAIFAALGHSSLAFLGLLFEHLGSSSVTPNVALPWLIPFVILLACIATMPFLALHFWERHYHHIALALALPVCIYYIFFLKPDVAAASNFFDQRAGRSLAHSLGDYISFIFLLGSLYVVSGGILIRVRRKATPAVNAALLLSGAVLANIFGTTGAAVLLIRPYLRINKGHIRPFHIIFFIFLVANVGGCLTPIGDPPLFLGFLRGVPFWWVLEKCWPMWLHWWSVPSCPALSFSSSIAAPTRVNLATTPTIPATRGPPSPSTAHPIFLPGSSPSSPACSSTTPSTTALGNPPRPRPPPSPPARTNHGRRHRRLSLDHAPAHPCRKCFQFRPHQRSRPAIHRHLRHHGPRPQLPLLPRQ